MMNRGVMDRQMFRSGGAAGFPDLNKDGKVTQADILMGRGVEFKQEGGIAGMMAAPGMAGGMAAQTDMPSEAVSQAAGAMDPAVLEQMLGTVDQNIRNLDDAEDFETVMNAMRGDDATVEERYDELAQIVGPEDAAQTPESVLALVQPVMQLAAIDQGIGGLAQEEMTEPVEGAMAEGIMSTVAPPPQEAAPMPPAGMGGPPPVNFNQGGLVRRGDNQPVKMMSNGGDPLQPFYGPRVDITPEESAILRQNIDIRDLQKQLTEANAKAGAVPSVTPLSELFADRKAAYRELLGDQGADMEQQKRLTQAQMLFDIANTALTFAAPMQGERAGMSPAERLAMAATATKLPQTIGARAQAQLDAEQAAKKEGRALDLAALQAAEKTRETEQASRSAFLQKRMELDAKTVKLGPDDVLVNSKGETIAEGAGSTVTVAPNTVLMNKKTGEVLGKGINTSSINGIPIDIFNSLDEKGKNLILYGNPSVNGIPASIFAQLSREDQNKVMKLTDDAVKGIPRAIFDGLSEDDQRKVLLGAEAGEELIKGIPKSVFDGLPQILQTQILGGLVTTSKDQTVTDITTEETVVEGKTDPILKVVNNQLVLVDPDTKKGEAIFGKPKEPPAKFMKITRGGVETVINANSAAGKAAIEKANNDNAANPGSAEVSNIGTEVKPTPKAFLIPGTGVVTSYDRGVTYTTADGEIKEMPKGPGAAFPLSDTISYDIYRKESIRQTAKDRLASADDAMTTALTRTDGTIAPATDQTTVRNALLAARNATGPWANFTALMDGVIAGTIPSDTIRNMAQDTQDNRQFIRALKILGSSALSVSPRMAVYDLARVERLFPDPDAFFRNPISEANKLVVLKQIAVQQRTRNDQALAAGIDDATLQSEIIRKNFEIDRLLSLLEGVDASGGGMDSSIQEQLMNDILSKRGG